MERYAFHSRFLDKVCAFIPADLDENVYFVDLRNPQGRQYETHLTITPLAKVFVIPFGGRALQVIKQSQSKTIRFVVFQGVFTSAVEKLSMLPPSQMEFETYMASSFLNGH